MLEKSFANFTTCSLIGEISLANFCSVLKQLGLVKFLSSKNHQYSTCSRKFSRGSIFMDIDALKHFMGSQISFCRHTHASMPVCVHKSVLTSWV